MNRTSTYVFLLPVFMFACVLASAPQIAKAAPPYVVSAKFTASNAVTLVYSEAAYTTLNDYSSFTGALNGANLSSLSGSGTNTIVLTFSNKFPANATGGLTTSSGVRSTIDNAASAGGPITIYDGQKPTFSSITVSSNNSSSSFATAGNTLTVSFSTNEAIHTPSVRFNGYAASVSGGDNSTGAFTATYTVNSSDTQDLMPINISFSDTSGNLGGGSFTVGGNSTTGVNISSITSNATTAKSLRAGDTITFVATLSTATPNATISGSYNGIPLSWSTSNGGATYTATYTVQAGHNSNALPLQISNVTLTDSSGRVSVAASGTDVRATISAQSFNISTKSAISSPSSTGNPIFTFYSPQDGTISYGGPCTSPVLTASLGDNPIRFNTLADGTYSNCTITVTSDAGYKSNTITVPVFTVSTGAGWTNTTNTTVPSTNTSSVYSYKFYNPLKLGSSGADVTALQKRLSAEGFFSGSATGYYGALTEAAVKAYQKAHGLTQLGNVGPGTRASLNGN